MRPGRRHGRDHPDIADPGQLTHRFSLAHGRHSFRVAATARPQRSVRAGRHPGVPGGGGHTERLGALRRHRPAASTRRLPHSEHLRAHPHRHVVRVPGPAGRRDHRHRSARAGQQQRERRRQDEGRPLPRLVWRLGVSRMESEPRHDGLPGQRRRQRRRPGCHRHLDGDGDRQHEGLQLCRRRQGRIRASRFSAADAESFGRRSVPRRGLDDSPVASTRFPPLRHGRRHTVPAA